MNESAWLILAGKLGVEAPYASALFAEMEAKGWIAGDGEPVEIPSKFLLAAWQAHQAKAARPAPGKSSEREAWHVEADIKRIKAEVKRITDDPASRNAAHGFALTWDQHKDVYREAWLAQVKACHDELAEKFPDEFAAFEASFAEAREEMRKGAKMLGMDPKLAEGDDARLEHFAKHFPKDCPDFKRWDREWNKAATWKDPNGITGEARAEIELLKGRLSELEGELRGLLVGVG